MINLVKLVCIDNSGLDESLLTVNKIYDCYIDYFSQPIDSYTLSIIDNSGHARSYKRNRFVTLDEFRDKKIINILN